jgi:uncharacterized phage protein (TIGR02218 family)
LKTVPAGLTALLLSGVTTLCRCWRVTRTDAQVFGFTDHDRTLSFGGVDYEPETGFTASETESSLGLAVDTMEVAGALRSDRITDSDIALGLWDDADIEIYVVDWTAVANRVIVKKGNMGEIARGDLFYSSEVRGLAHRLNQVSGRTYQRQCDAVLGDSRCGVDLDDPDFSGSGSVVTAIDDRVLTVSGLSGFATGLFNLGLLTWTSGANAGARIELRGHVGSRLTLFQRAALPIEPGDDFDIAAGCDKSWAMCRERFENGENFRGFPHIPGNDFALSVAKKDAPNDGGSFFND